MKLKYLLMGALVGVAFTACTNDDEPAVNNGPSRSADAKDYVAVKFVMPGEATTRAWDGNENTGYEAGSEAENTVTKALFFFMKGNAQVADPYEITAGDTGNMEALEGTVLNPWSNGTEKTIEKLSKAVIVLANKVENPTHIIAVLNAGLSDLKLSKTSTLGDIQAVVADYAAEAMTTSGKFVMSSSVYDDVKAVIGAEVSEDKIYDDLDKCLEDVKANPQKATVRIPVERVVAKVEVTTDDAVQNTGNSEDATKPSTTVSVDGTDVTITAEINGWWLDNTPSQSLLIKKLDEEKVYTTVSADLKKSWYDDAKNYRSYWATPNTGTLKHFAFPTGDEDDSTIDNGIVPSSDPRYTLENTDQANPTQVVVAATLKVKAGDAEAKAVDLVKYMGVLYTQEGFNTELANVLAHKYWKVDPNDATKKVTVGAADIKFTYTKKTDPQYEAEVTLAKADDSAVWYTKGTGEEYTEANPAADFTALKRTVQFWNGGKTYYFVKIVQNDGITVGTGDKAHELYGVIRNHWYKITAKSVNGLGTPVPFADDDTTPIIPVIPEDSHSYISAEIAILKWKIVEQEVDLGK